MAHTKKEIRDALFVLPDWQKPEAFLRATEHYDVSAEGETKNDWIEEVASIGYEPYLVSINLGGYTGTTVAVAAKNPDEALETADEWTQTRYYGGSLEDYDEAIEREAGPVAVYNLFDAARAGNPASVANPHQDLVNITPEATYWFRTSEGKWYKTSRPSAASIYETPAGAYAKGRKGREVAVLAAMPPAYTSKSDVQRGLGVVLWTWDFGPKTCKQVKERIERWVEDDVRKAEIYGREVPRYVHQYRTLGERLCGHSDAFLSNPTASNPVRSTKSLKNKLLR